VTNPTKVCLDASPIPSATDEDGHFTAALEQLIDNRLRLA